MSFQQRGCTPWWQPSSTGSLYLRLGRNRIGVRFHLWKSLLSRKWIRVDALVPSQHKQHMWKISLQQTSSIQNTTTLLNLPPSLKQKHLLSNHYNSRWPTRVKSTGYGLRSSPEVRITRLRAWDHRGPPSITSVRHSVKQRRARLRSISLLRLSPILPRGGYGHITVGHAQNQGDEILLTNFIVGDSAPFPGVYPAPAIKSNLINMWQGQLRRRGYAPQFGWNPRTGEPWLVLRCFAREVFTALCGMYYSNYIVCHLS